MAGRGVEILFDDDDNDDNDPVFPAAAAATAAGPGVRVEFDDDDGDGDGRATAAAAAVVTVEFETDNDDDDVTPVSAPPMASAPAGAAAVPAGRAVPEHVRALLAARPAAPRLAEGWPQPITAAIARGAELQEVYARFSASSVVGERNRVLVTQLLRRLPGRLLVYVYPVSMAEMIPCIAVHSAAEYMHPNALEGMRGANDRLLPGNGKYRWSPFLADMQRFIPEIYAVVRLRVYSQMYYDRRVGMTPAVFTEILRGVLVDFARRVANSTVRRLVIADAEGTPIDVMTRLLYPAPVAVRMIQRLAPAAAPAPAPAGVSAATAAAAPSGISAGYANALNVVSTVPVDAAVSDGVEQFYRHLCDHVWVSVISLEGVVIVRDLRLMAFESLRDAIRGKMLQVGASDAAAQQSVHDLVICLRVFRERVRVALHMSVRVQVSPGGERVRLYDVGTSAIAAFNTALSATSRLFTLSLRM